jgi:hypothetical protein
MNFLGFQNCLKHDLGFFDLKRRIVILERSLGGNFEGCGWGNDCVYETIFQFFREHWCHPCIDLDEIFQFILFRE